MRSQIFRQIAQKFRRHTVVWQGISGQYDGKSASRLRAKPSGGLYSVFPKFCLTALCSVSAIFAGKKSAAGTLPFSHLKWGCSLPQHENVVKIAEKCLHDTEKYSIMYHRLFYVIVELPETLLPITLKEPVTLKEREESICLFSINLEKLSPIRHIPL